MQLNKSGDFMRMRGFCNLSAPTIRTLKTIRTTIRTFENDTHYDTHFWKWYALTIRTTIRTLKNDTHYDTHFEKRYALGFSDDTHFWKRYALRYALLRTIHTTIRTSENDAHSMILDHSKVCIDTRCTCHQREETSKLSIDKFMAS